MKFDLPALKDGLFKGDRRSLAKAITLIESSLEEHQSQAATLLSEIMPQTGKSLRIGISGSPGVGKSTFIEALGSQLLKEGNSFAVLTVDPSSPITGGSILGDKTRMPQLSASPQVFIRPSPSGDQAGGVNRKTRESILLCEAAGFDLIFVETVGVGQSEVMVSSMVDAFVILQLPNAGDELQGIKKGILELSDVVVITKADGDQAQAAKRTQLEHERALSLLDHGHWKTPVIPCSSLKMQGIEDVWQSISSFVSSQRQSGQFEDRRSKQRVQWFDQELLEVFKAIMSRQADFLNAYQKSAKKVQDDEIPASIAAQQLLNQTIFKGV